ncbi:dTMP kinase [Gordonia soli]|uniref:Thymidylate kinase n=1 Tax=Gordonia soli NBRC 108243 TaxID=1223545 RepID=M0QH37_9ACTN|nr:dTMP kinase [Gordonia soli]GAC66742.1 thymidylate kinase [Gordonia soli NBRC 108243]
MGELIAVEGIDGAGKNTMVRGLVEQWRSHGDRVATFTFPRYGESVTADLAAEALHGSHGDLRESVYGMAVLFALDRAGAASEIFAAMAENDVVILDRYVASNAAYNAARLHQDADGEVVRWVADLEFGRLGLPVPDRHLFLGVPADVALGRAARRAEIDSDRARDHYERDHDLQHRVDAVYRGLAHAGWMSPWLEVTDVAEAAATARPSAG